MLRLRLLRTPRARTVSLPYSRVSKMCIRDSGTAVEITKFSERDSGVIDIDATIYCEKASHKGIIIGKNGSMLKKISTEAREDCERFMGTKVFLQTWVKVKENWRDSQTMIRNFGYE